MYLIFSYSPITVGVLLIGRVVFSAIITSFTSGLWFFLSVIIIYIGGLIVIILFLTSLSDRLLLQKISFKRIIFFLLNLSIAEILLIKTINKYINYHFYLSVHYINSHTMWFIIIFLILFIFRVLIFNYVLISQKFIIIKIRL